MNGLMHQLGFNFGNKVPLEMNQVKQPRQLFCDDFKFCESFSGKNILITGASGAIGTQVTRILMTQSNAPNIYLFVRDDGNI